MKKTTVASNTDAQEKFLKIFFFIYPFLIGGYHEFVSCAASVVLFVFTALTVKKDGEITIKTSLPFIAVSALVASYAVSALWAIDGGLALWGAVKFLPLFPLSLTLMRLGSEKKDGVFSVVPLSGALMTLLSFGLKFIKPLKSQFTVSNRLAGFFQYPNVFALFCLAGIIISATKKKIGFSDVLSIGILIFGIFESGSRTVFALFVLSVIILLFCVKSRKIKFSLLGLTAAGITAAVIYALATDNFQTIGRFLTSSFGGSTFLGRLLYYKDALPVILKRPFGLGYMGYRFAQSEFQTGVYSVMFVHNEALQVLLDVGWIPGILLFAAIIKSFFSRRTTATQKLLLFIISAHCALDFDLQFVSVFSIFVACLDFDGGKEKKIKISPGAAFAVLGVATAACLYFGTAQFFQYIGDYKTAAKIYPANTLALIENMSAEEDIGKANETAKKILKRNKSAVPAYRVRAGYEFSKGNAREFIELKETAIKKSPYDVEEYEDYAVKLITLAQKFHEAGSAPSERYCIEKLAGIPEELKKVEAKTDPFAWKIKDVPRLKLSGQIEGFIKSLPKENLR